MDPVEGEQCKAETKEEFLKNKNLIAAFEFKANLLLQRTGMKLSEKLSDKSKHPIDSWNESQVFYGHDLAKAYGELICLSEFDKSLVLTMGENEDT